MSEFEDKLHAILSDPAELERIASMAAALMGGGEGSGAPGDPTGPLRRLSGLLGGAGERDGDPARTEYRQRPGKIEAISQNFIDL